jgi:putative protein-disulfide isomerase
MRTPHLIYFADPMCSWCYGFSPVIDAIRGAFGERLPMRVIMGGLRPGEDEPMDEAAKARMRGYWGKVREATGLPFSDAAMGTSGFVYDTDPACRAVVVGRRLGGEDLAASLLGRIQRAFYAEAQEITQAGVLAGLAEEFGLERQAFLDDWGSHEAKREAWRDYSAARQAGATAYPTLAAGSGDGAYGLVTEGWAPADQVVAALRDWLERLAA